MAIHEGHRQRLKERFLDEGLDTFNEINALELILFYCVPRQDTNPLAHRLLERFGSISGVFNATTEELEKVEGVGSNISTYLTLIAQSWRYYNVDQNRNITVLSTLKECGDYLMPYFIGRRNEMVYLLCLDAKCKLLCCKKLGEDSVNSAAVPMRRIVETAMNENATSVVLAHNHPSGLAFPSDEDIATTKRLAVALQAVDICLADHIVVADDDYVSMTQSGCFKPGEPGVVL